MKIDINNLVSISEANQNFSKIARLVDERGTAVILKNNKPKYVLVEYSQLEKDNSDSEIVADEEVDYIVKKTLSKHMDAFKELAK